jgi:hypothetical protein
MSTLGKRRKPHFLLTLIYGFNTIKSIEMLTGSKMEGYKSISFFSPFGKLASQCWWMFGYGISSVRV